MNALTAATLYSFDPDASSFSSAISMAYDEPTPTPVAAATAGQAVYAMLGVHPTFVAIDAALSSVLSTTKLSDGYGEGYALVKTCAGFLAIWSERNATTGVQSLKSAALDTLGQLHTWGDDMHEYTEVDAQFSAAWDGQSVTVVQPYSLIELGINGEILSVTPSQKEVLRAVSTEEGFVVWTQEGSGTSIQVEEIQRGTGSPTRSVGEIPYSAWGANATSLAITERYMTFAMTSSQIDGIVAYEMRCIAASP